jgi:Ni,Fe-hydrogenase III large subunit
VASIAAVCPAADWVEREVRDYYGLDFMGRDDTPPLMLREGDERALFVRTQALGRDADPADTARRTGSGPAAQPPAAPAAWSGEADAGGAATMSPVIPVGPYHPALEEPYKIELVCDGETISDSRITVGFNFRAIEWLAERKNYTQDLALVERVCGICSNVHTLTFSRALEQLAGVEVPERAQHIRVVVHEAERLHSHLLWAGIACELIGFQTLFMTCFALRETVMDVLEAVSGNRVNYAMNKPGGVTRDIPDPAAVIAAAREIGRVTSEQLVPVLTGDPTVRARCAGVGVLTREQALAWGALGPVARASGLTQDMRRAAPYEI